MRRHRQSEVAFTLTVPATEIERALQTQCRRLYGQLRKGLKAVKQTIDETRIDPRSQVLNQPSEGSSGLRQRRAKKRATPTLYSASNRQFAIEFRPTIH